MKEYYTHDGQNKQGPFTLEDLLKSNIQAETPVWHSGLDVWVPAKNLEELNRLFETKTPPPFERVQPPPVSALPPTQHPPQKTSTKNSIWGILGRAVLGTLIVGVIAMVLQKMRSQTGGGYVSPSTYSESKMSVADYERSHPAEFLDADGTYNQALFSNKMKVHGTVTNKATVANFKDISIEVTYYSSTKTLISTERFVLYEYVPAHSKKSFEWKIKPPGGTSSMSWDAVDATPYY